MATLTRASNTLVDFSFPPSRPTEEERSIDVILFLKARRKKNRNTMAEWKRPPSFLSGEWKTDATKLVNGRRATVHWMTKPLVLHQLVSTCINNST